MKFKQKIKRLAQTLQKILTVVAVLAIAWSILSFFDKITQWWALPLIAFFTGVIGTFLPKIAKVIRPFHSVVSTGISLLAINSVFEFIPKEFRFLGLLAILVVISILTDLFVSYRTTTGDILFDITLSVVATVIINFFGVLIITLPILLGLYSLVLLIQFDFRFSLKSNKQITTQE